MVLEDGLGGIAGRRSVEPLSACETGGEGSRGCNV